MEFGAKLNVLARKLSDDIVVVMRTYFEKPRTRLGWKGFINDPDLDGTSNMDKV
jgi:3-deoxy-7-phosphoheptulonate synthase